MIHRTRRDDAVAFVIPAFRVGGAERVMVNVASQVASRGTRVYVCTADVDGPFRDLLGPDVQVVGLGSERARSVIPALGRALRALRPTAVLSTLSSNITVGILRLARLTDARVVMREGNTTSAFLDEVAQSSPHLAKLYRSAYRTVYRTADAVVCQSQAMAADLLRIASIPAGRVHVILNPVDVDLVGRLGDQACELDRLPGPHVVAVGRCAPQKGYDLLITALGRLLRTTPLVQLWILGDGSECGALQALAARLGVADHVHFLGNVDNPFPYVRAADLFVSSSRYEGVSNSMLEALVCGTTVLASDCPSGVREIITPGRDGWLCAPGDSDILAEAMGKALVSSLTLAPEAIREESASRFGLAAAADAYNAVLTGS